MNRPLTQEEQAKLVLLAAKAMLTALREVAKASSLKQAHMAAQSVLEKIDRKAPA